MSTSPLTIEEKFQAVPQVIRDWFWSDEMDEIILAIDRKFGLTEDETTLPRLLFDVEIKDLPLENLEAKLIEGFSLAAPAGHTLYEEVKAKIFLPHAHDFYAFGIGTTDLKEAAQAAAPAPATTLPRPAVAAAPIVSAPGAPQPAPVSLYKDTFASQAPLATPRLAGRDTGDISASFMTPAAPQRAARIDLGVPAPSSKKDEEFKSLFVERSTPLPQKVDYGVPPPALPDLPQAPVPLASAPAPVSDREQFIAPNIEVTRAPQAPQQTDAPEGGFFESFMHRVAPWHAKKFAKAKGEETLPAATINYSADPAVAPAPDAPAPVSLPDVPAAPVPPAPPAPLS